MTSLVLGKEVMYKRLANLKYLYITILAAES